MELKQVEIKNFMSFKEAVYNCGEGITFITGKNLTDNADSNGAGKSSFLEAILWCLYGKTMRECGANDVIRKGEKTTSVKVVLDVGGKEVVIRRTKEYGKSDKYESSTNIDLPEWKMFRLCNVFDKDSASFIASPPADRQRILDYFVNGEIIDKIQEKLRNLEKDLNNKQAELEKEVSNLEGKIQEKEEQLNTFKSHSYAEEINKLKQELAKLEKDVIPDLSKLESEYKQEIPEEEKLQEVNEKLLYEKSKVKNYEAQLSELNKKLSEAKNLKGSCPVCFRAIDKDVVSNISIVIKENIESITELLKNSQQDIKELEGMVNNLRNIIKEKKSAKEQILKQIQFQRDLATQIKYLKKQISNYEQLEGKKEAEIQEAEEVLAKLKDKKSSIEERLNQIPLELEEVLFLKRNFGSAGFRVWRLKKLLTALNMVIKSISSNIDFDVEFILVENSKGEISKLDIQIKDKNGEITSYESLSGGEKRRVTIMVLLALNTFLSLYGYNLNFIMFDEIFDTLDENGVSITMELLQELKEKGKQVFLVSHLNLLKTSDYDNLLEIKKVNSISMIDGGSNE